MIRIACFAVVWCAALQSNAAAEDISDFVKRSSAIGVVNIHSGSESTKRKIDEGCGVLYTAYVLDSVANMDEGSLVSFRSYSSLTIASAYLIFFIDGIDSNANASSTLAGIRAERCAESGVTLTAMVVGEGDRLDVGPSAILELRRKPGGSFDSYHKGDGYYFGPRAIDRLIGALRDGRPDCLKPIFADIERAQYVARGVLYPVEPFVTFLRKLANN